VKFFSLELKNQGGRRFIPALKDRVFAPSAEIKRTETIRRERPHGTEHDEEQKRTAALEYLELFACGKHGRDRPWQAARRRDPLPINRVNAHETRNSDYGLKSGNGVVPVCERPAREK